MLHCMLRLIVIGISQLHMQPVDIIVFNAPVGANSLAILISCCLLC